MTQKHTLTCCFITIVCLLFMPGIGTAGPTPPVDFAVVGGTWVRTDGPYTLTIRNITFDGSADVEYLNPNSIHVSKRHIDIHGGLIRLSVTLEDKGYPGSAYTLYYYAEKDALAGFYYQAAMDRTYEVIFLRK